ncbi:Hint domain-containing protein [Fusobacterium ulcerans]|uniref:Hint domain-containing protein n=1 Tax=Fusobacterium ulcerans TaxID=861 RepID=UPI00309CD258
MNNLKGKCINGCLARGTTLTMADGSRKRIEDLKIGDMVVVSNDGAKRITDIFTGHEERLIELQLENEMLLKATSDHPIMTEKGYKSLGKLDMLDKVVIEENQLKSIKMIFPIEYYDQVYNIVLEEPSAILCNNIWVGDFQIQNSLESDRYRNDDKTNNIEIKRLMEELENFKKGNI